MSKEANHNRRRFLTTACITLAAGQLSMFRSADAQSDLRAILGNDVAIKAYRQGKLPFPDGTIIARLAWSYVPSEENNKVFGRSQSFVAGPPGERGSVYGQGFNKIRVDRRLEVRSI